MANATLLRVPQVTDARGAIGGKLGRAVVIPPNGVITVPDTPGLGLVFDQEKIASEREMSGRDE